MTPGFDSADDGAAPAPREVPPVEPVLALWVPLAVGWLVAASLYAAAGFANGNALFLGAPTCFALCASIAHLRAGRRGTLPLTLLTLNGQLAMLAAAAVMATYAAATTGRPMIDASLLAIDRALGYRWQDYAALFARHHRIGAAVLSTYRLISILPFFTVSALALSGDVRPAQQYILAMAFALMLTIVLFAAFPARTAWGHAGLSPARLQPYLFLYPSTEGWERDLLEIRAGGGRVVQMGAGLIGFPSFHCISALLTAWAAWRVAVLRTVMTTISLLMILSTPISGGHYLTDLIGGACVSIVSVLAVRRLGSRGRGARQPQVGKEARSKFGRHRRHDRRGRALSA